MSSQRGLSPQDAKHTFVDYREMLKLPDLDAVAICTPPQVRHDIAKQVLQAGKSALLEKPPAATLSELEDLKRIASAVGKTLYTAWHAQHNDGVDAAREGPYRAEPQTPAHHLEGRRAALASGTGMDLAGGRVRRLRSRHRRLSILSRIMPQPIFVKQAALEFPASVAPIAANLVFASGLDGEDLQAAFDWRQTGEQTWNIDIETASGQHLLLSKGGARLEIDGKVVVDQVSAEYTGIYKQFDALLKAGASDVDAAPLRLAADAFLLARRTAVEAFEP